MLIPGLHSWRAFRRRKLLLDRDVWSLRALSMAISSLGPLSRRAAWLSRQLRNLREKRDVAWPSRNLGTEVRAVPHRPAQIQGGGGLHIVNTIHLPTTRDCLLLEGLKNLKSFCPDPLCYLLDLIEN